MSSSSARVPGFSRASEIGDLVSRGSLGAFPPGYVFYIQIMSAFPEEDAIRHKADLGLRYVVLHGASEPSDAAHSFVQIDTIIGSFSAGSILCPSRGKCVGMVGDQFTMIGHGGPWRMFALRQLTLLLPALVFVAVVTILGLIVISLLPTEWKRSLTPAAPVVGVSALVVGLYWAGLVFGTAVSTWILLSAFAVGLFVAWRRLRLIFKREYLIQGGLALLLGLLPALLILQPSASLTEGVVVHPTSIHDAFFYTSAAEWLRGHPLTEQPDINPHITADSQAPAYAPALTTQLLSIRQGEHLIQAAAVSFGQDRVSSQWYQLQAAWLLVLPGSVLAFGRLIGMSRRATWLGAISMTGASLLSFQALNQNSPSLLGLAILPLALGLLVRALDPQAEHGWVDAALAAGCIAALIGVYSELLVLLALLPIGLVFANATGPRWVLEHGLKILGLSVLISPWAWFLAAQTFLRLAPATSVLGPPSFWGTSAGVVANRFLGLASIDESRPASLLTLAAAVLFLLGIISSLRHPGLRWVTASVVLSASFLWLSHGARGGFYLMDRVVMIAQPILFLVSGIGIGVLIDRISAGRALAKGDQVLGTAGSVALALVLLASAANLSSTQRLVMSQGGYEQRAITPEIQEAVAWVEEIASADGSDLTVLVDDYVARLWVADGLRDFPGVAFAILTPDYFRVRSYVDSRVDRYVLTSPWVFTNLPSEAKVRENSRFVLYDTEGTDALFLATRENFWGPEYSESGVFEWMSDAGVVVTLRSDVRSALALATGANLELGVLQVMVTPGGGVEWGTFVASDDKLDVIRLPEEPVVEFVLVNQVPAAPLSTTDQRRVSVRIDAVDSAHP